MKKIIKPLLLLFAIVNMMQLNAQSTCSTAQDLNSYSGSTLSQSTALAWYSFSATSTSMLLDIYDADTTFVNFDSAMVYQGSCASLTLVARVGKPAVTHADSIFTFELPLYGIQSGNTYYLKVKPKSSYTPPFNYKIRLIDARPAACQLIYNGDFEYNPGCFTAGGPCAGGQVIIPSWFTGSQSGREHAINICSLADYNGWTQNGLYPPHSGNGMMTYLTGYLAYPGGGTVAIPTDLHTYPQSQLTSPMQNSSKYYVQLFYKRDAYQGGDVSDGLGIYLSNGIPSYSTGPFPYCWDVLTPTVTPQFAMPSGSLIMNYTWMPFGGLYTASGGEDHITIGDFKSAALTTFSQTTVVCCHANAMIDIDDVSITKLSYNIPDIYICKGGSVTPSSFACYPPYTTSTFSWFPSAGLSNTSIPNPVVSPTVNTTYSLVQVVTNTLGATSSVTNILVVHVNYSVTPISVSVSPNPVCTGGSATLTASVTGASGYTWSPGSSTLNPLVVNPTVTTTYTVNSMVPGCPAQGTITLDVYTVAPTYTATLSDAFVCIPTGSTSTVSTLSMSPSGTYTVLIPTSPVTSSVFTNSISLTVTATANYTVQQYNGSGCLTNTIVTVTKVPCACLSAPGVTLGGLATASINLTPNVAYKVVSDFTLQGAGPLYFNQNDVAVYPGVKISISGYSPGSTVNVIGSHFHGCGEMWKGIEILYSSCQLNVTSGTLGGISKTSMIEDAYIGINAINTPTDSNGNPLGFNTNVLTVDSTIFNKNIVGIRIQNCNLSSTSYPFKIMNSLFTSRNITYSVNSWPLTNTVKNSTAVTTSSMQTPYINSSTYAVSTFSSSLYNYNGYPQAGIVLDHVGYTDNSTSYTFYGMQIGASGTNDFNCFDNNYIDINAVTSNFSVINSVFQNGNRFGKGSSQGGRAITAQSTDATGGVINRNQIKITNYGSTGGDNCRFYEKTSAADVTNYFSTIIENAAVYSYSNTYSNFYLVNTYGEKGFNIKTNRYLEIKVQNNKLYNIKNSMLIGLNYMPIVFFGYPFNYREIGSMTVYNNTVDKYIGTIPPGSSPYINIGLNITDVTTGGFGTLINPVSISITNNNFNNVNNGMQVSNISDSPVGINTNTVVMLNETPIYTSTPVQKGIATINNVKEVFIGQNSVTGPSSWGTEMRNISTTANTSLSVRCNTTEFAQAGIEFNNPQFVDFFEDNQMKNQTYGLRLDNSSVLVSPFSGLGSSTRPTNNIWNGTWSSPNYMTYTDGGSSAQYGKLYVKYGTGTGLDPDGLSATTGFTNSPADLYFHTVYPGPVTLLSSSGITPSCRIGGTGGGTGMPGMQRLFELAVQDSIDYSINVSENQYMDNLWAYRSINSNTDIVGSTYTGTVLSNWYSNAQNSIQDTMVLIEKKLSNGAIDTANTLISLFHPANTIESNYKLFYQLYSKTKDSTFTTTDSTSLDGLANSCPYNNGMVVYQARALFNIYYDGFYTFFNNCGSNGSAGRFMNHSQQEEKKEIKVELKSDIYPNPNDGSYTLKINKNVEEQNVEISIFDITGRLISKDNRVITRGSEIGVKSDLKDGMYLLKVKFEDGSYDVHHLIISK